MTDDGTRAKKA